MDTNDFDTQLRRLITVSSRNHLDMQGRLQELGKRMSEHAQATDRVLEMLTPLAPPAAPLYGEAPAETDYPSEFQGIPNQRDYSYPESEQPFSLPRVAQPRPTHR